MSQQTETAVIILNGSGAGTAKVGPTNAYGAPWNVISASVRANANPTNEAMCTLYAGPDTSQPNFRDTSFTGSSGDGSDKVAGPLLQNNFVFAVWSGGDANVQATLTVVLEKNI